MYIISRKPLPDSEPHSTTMGDSEANTNGALAKDLISYFKEKGEESVEVLEQPINEVCEGNVPFKGGQVFALVISLDELAGDFHYISTLQGFGIPCHYPIYKEDRDTRYKLSVLPTEMPALEGTPPTPAGQHHFDLSLKQEDGKGNVTKTFKKLLPFDAIFNELPSNNSNQEKDDKFLIFKKIRLYLWRRFVGGMKNFKRLFGWLVPKGRFRSQMGFALKNRGGWIALGFSAFMLVIIWVGMTQKTAYWKNITFWYPNDHDWWSAWLDPVVGMGIFLVTIMIWLMKNRQEWLQKLQKKLTVSFEHNGKTVFLCENAYLSSEGDIRQWGQQIGRQMNESGLLSFYPFIKEEDLPPRKDAKEGFVKPHKVTIELIELPRFEDRNVPAEKSHLCKALVEAGYYRYWSKEYKEMCWVKCPS